MLWGADDQWIPIETGQIALYRQIAQMDMKYPDEVEPRYGAIRSHSCAENGVPCSSTSAGASSGPATP